MGISIFLARFWGSLFMILGGLTLAANFLGQIIEYTKDKTITISTGYITFLLGLATVVSHNIWATDFRLAITILGWVTLLKGMEKIGFPNRVAKKALLFKSGQKVWGGLIFLIDVWYFWLSFHF